MPPEGFPGCLTIQIEIRGAHRSGAFGLKFGRDSEGGSLRYARCVDRNDAVSLGLGSSGRQFLLLALVNCFVGTVVGAQRSILPLAGSTFFGVESAAAVGSFVISFGVVKACMNLLAGRWAERFGRRRILLAGWAAGVPIPLLLWLAAEQHAWWLVVLANVFLGLNQGLCWTMTVVMKVDLVGPARRGLALGVNECAGYTSVAVSAFVVSMVATEAMPLRGVIGMTGLGAVAGLVVSAMLVRETLEHARFAAEVAASTGCNGGGGPNECSSGRNGSGRARFAAAQAGLICNLNDAVIWTTLPALLALRGLEKGTIGLFAAMYPAVWGVAQLGAGWLSDRTCRVRMIVLGMLTQGAGHFVLGIGRADARVTAGIGCTLLGLGTALAYPTLLAFVADHSPVERRSASLGVYRFWRDSGYALGALAAGLIADASGYTAAIHASGAATVLSGIAVAVLVQARGGGGVRRETPIAVVGDQDTGGTG